MSFWRRLWDVFTRNHPYRDREEFLPADLVALFRRIGPETWNHLPEIEQALEEHFWSYPGEILEIINVLAGPLDHPRECAAAFLGIKQRLKSEELDETRTAALTAAIIPLLDHKHVAIRVRVVEILSNLRGRGAEGIVPALLGALSDPDQIVSREVVYALSGAGSEAVKGLVTIIGQGDELSRARAVDALILIGMAGREEDLPSLVKALVASGSGRALDSVGEVIVQILPRVQERVPESLDQIRPLLSAGISGAFTRIDTEAEEYRRVEFTGRLVTALEAEPALIDVVLEGLDDPRRHVRRAVIWALCDIGENARPALPRIMMLVHEDPTNEVRFQAARLLQTLENGLDDERVPVVVEPCEDLVYFSERVRGVLPERIRFEDGCPLMGHLTKSKSYLTGAFLGEGYHLEASASYQFASSDELLDDYSPVPVAGPAPEILEEFEGREVRVTGDFLCSEYTFPEHMLINEIVGQNEGLPDD